MTDIIGWISSILFGLCAVPQAWQSYKTGNSEGVNMMFLWLWLLGEMFAQVYVYQKHGLDMPLLVNYWFNMILIMIIMKYKYKPIKRDL